LLKQHWLLLVVNFDQERIRGIGAIRRSRNTRQCTRRGKVVVVISIILRPLFPPQTSIALVLIPQTHNSSSPHHLYQRPAPSFELECFVSVLRKAFDRRRRTSILVEIPLRFCIDIPWVPYRSPGGCAALLCKQQRATDPNRTVESSGSFPLPI